jgi:superfamily II DNA/RNA helicase
MMLPESGPTFEELYGDRLPQWLTSRATELGFARPTEVQRAALDTILDGEDVVLQAQTGKPNRHLSFLLSNIRTWTCGTI